jgi:hypothetical protein
MKYDQADWHYGGRDFGRLPHANGATHFGMFLGWCIKRGLVGALHLELNPLAVEEVQRGSLTGRDFVVQCCDEKFTSDDLNDEGNRFASDYYADHYFDDYANSVGDDAPSIYAVSDTPKNHSKIEALLDRRLAAWRERGKAGLASS